MLTHTGCGHARGDAEQAVDRGHAELPALRRRGAPADALFFYSLLLSSLELSDTKVYESEIRARLGTALFGLGGSM